jgi:hypothetical protein
VIELDVCDVWLEESGVIRMRFKPCDVHGLDQAIAVVAAHNKVAKGERRQVLADIREITTGADREARAYYVSEEAAKYKIGMAMLAKSPMQRMLGNIFFRINRPPYASKLFSEEANALSWLKGLGASG